jgi:4-hydroxy-3-methylbut-2-enyl diphosphate reductase
VVRAIRMAENELEKGVLYSLGDIVHNEQEVARLNRYGMCTVNREELEQLHGVKALIRAHGEPPVVYRIAEENGLTIVDATCPVVLNLQKKVHQAYIRSQQDGGQVVIYGKPGHAEVNGLVGQTGDTAVVIASDEETDKIDALRPIYLFAQTTMTIAGLQRIREAIEKTRAAHHSTAPFEVNDTICRQVSNRETSLARFARLHDAVVFVCGSKSSNGKALYEVCRRANPDSFMIAGAADLREEWFRHAKLIGICGATSTPRWLMEEVAEKIRQS